MESLKILIPTDFSVQAEYAYIMVKKLAEKMRLEVHFAHIMNMPDTVTLGVNGEIATCGEIDVQYVKAQKEIADRKLNELKQMYGTDIHTQLHFGKLTNTIINISTSGQFDLIVMGTKGAWGVKEKLSGSETQMVARKSTIPVLSLMCDRSDLVIKNLLLVHNFNNPANEDLTLMKKLVDAFGIKIHLLQIHNKTGEAEKTAIENKMREFAILNEIHQFESHVIQDTNVENGVIHFNQMNNMDIICIGTHGRGGLFHHSATEALINHMYKPIISFQLK